MRVMRQAGSLPGLGGFLGHALRRGLGDLVANVFRCRLIGGHGAAGAKCAQCRVRKRHRVRQRFAIDGSRRGNRGQPRTESRRRIACQGEGDVGQNKPFRRVQRCRLQRAPFAERGIPCVVGPVNLVHPGIERREHAGRRRIAPPGALRAGQQGADRHDRQIQAECEALSDARRGTKTGERSRAGAEGNGVAIRQFQTGLVEKFANGGQQARAGYRAGLLVAHPDSRFGPIRNRGPACGIADGGQERYRAEFGRGIEGKKHSLSHGPYCNRHGACRCGFGFARGAAPNVWNKPSAPRQHAVVMIISPA